MRGVCREEAEKLIQPFKTWIITNRPYVTLKLGMTIDGKIADRDGNSKWITSSKSRKRVQDLRKRVDAILVGRTTAVADDPALTCRPAKKPAPYRIVTDSQGRLPLDAKLLNDNLASHTIVATTTQCSSRRQSAYRRKGAQVWVIPSRGKRVSLRPLMNKLAKEGIIHVLCEGGGELAAELARLNIIDEYKFFIAPRILGGRVAEKTIPAMAGTGWSLANCPKLEFDDVQRIGEDVMITAHPRTRGA